MILSDAEIQEEIAGGRILIDPPPDEEQYTSSAVDLLLGDEFLQLKTPQELAEEEPAGVERPFIVDCGTVDIRGLVQKYGKPIPKEADDSFLLAPNMFVLGITRERVDLPRVIAARVEGRSTLARLGLVVHFTAPTIHAGFRGHIVLEMYNFGCYHLRLHPGKLAICQLIFERVGRAPEGPVKSEFVDQRGIR